MTLQSIYQRLFPKGDDPATVVPLPSLSGLDEHDMETVVIHPSYDAPRERDNGYIAIVGFAPGDVLTNGLFFSAAEGQDNPALRAINLPGDRPGDLTALYDLEYADLILYALDTRRELSSSNLRWLTRLQSLDIPIVVLLHGVDRVSAGALPRLLKALADQLNRPVVPVYATNYAKTRDELIQTVYQISPRLAAVLSIHAPLLRPVLARHLLAGMALTSLDLDILPADDDDISALSEAQVRLVRQIKAVYGKGTRLSRDDYQALMNMAEGMTRYVQNVTAYLPILDHDRRKRLSYAITTMLVGYVTMIYHGETPPEIRKQVLPQIWRLYRASGQMANS